MWFMPKALPPSLPLDFNLPRQNSLSFTWTDKHSTKPKADASNKVVNQHQYTWMKWVCMQWKKVMKLMSLNGNIFSLAKRFCKWLYVLISIIYWCFVFSCFVFAYKLSGNGEKFPKAQGETHLLFRLTTSPKLKDIQLNITQGKENL